LEWAFFPVNKEMDNGSFATFSCRPLLSR
jgi:hypothetical protein